MKHKPNILISGPIIPPYGGISIHIKRLCDIIKHDFNIKLIDESAIRKENIFNLRSMNLFAYLKLLAWSDLVFIHSGNRFFKKIHIILSTLLRKKIIITLHGYGIKRNFLMRHWDQLVFSQAHKIILVNEEIHDKIKLPKQKCEVKHAFMPPDMDEETPLPQTIQDKINCVKNNGDTIIVANASRLDTFLSKDLYGLDMAVESAKKLKAKNIKFHFIYTVSALDQGQSRYEEAMREIEKNELQDVFTLYAGLLSFPKLISCADIVVRPTNTDGDSISVREGLFFNKAVIASDVVSRPNGSILFKTRDVDDFTEKLSNEIIECKLRTKIQSESDENRNSYQTYYTRILEEVLSI